MSLSYYSYNDSGLCGGLGEGAGVPVLAPTLQTAATAGAGIATAAVAGTSLAVPIVGATIAGVALAIGLWMNRLKPKQKVATTKIVDEAAQFMVQNLDAWNQSDKTQVDKDQAIANFWNIWNQVAAACGQDQMGEPGSWCIEDRLPNGYNYLAPNGKTYIGNGKWNWFEYYLTPIQSYIPQKTGSFANDLFSGAEFGGSTGLIIGAGLLMLGGLFFMGKGK